MGCLTLEVSGAGRNVWKKRKRWTGVRLTEMLGDSPAISPPGWKIPLWLWCYKCDDRCGLRAKCEPFVTPSRLRRTARMNPRRRDERHTTQPHDRNARVGCESLPDADPPPRRPSTAPTEAKTMRHEACAKRLRRAHLTNENKLTP